MPIKRQQLTNAYCKCKNSFSWDIHTFEGDTIYECSHVYPLFAMDDLDKVTVKIPSLLVPSEKVSYPFHKNLFNSFFEYLSQEQVRDMRLDNILYT